MRGEKKRGVIGNKEVEVLGRIVETSLLASPTTDDVVEFGKRSPVLMRLWSDDGPQHS